MQLTNTHMAHYASMNHDPKGKKSSSVTLHFQKGKTKKTFKAADVRTGHAEYGAESKTKPTPDFVKKAQAAQVDVIHRDGKPYRAGHTTEHKESDTHATRLDHTPTIPKRAKSNYETMKTQQSTAEIRQKSGSPMKRRLPRVEWLSGKNKKTEAGYGR